MRAVPEGDAMKYVCDCGRLFKEHQTVVECKRRNHGRGGNWRTRLNKAAPKLLEACRAADGVVNLPASVHRLIRDAIKATQP